MDVATINLPTYFKLSIDLTDEQFFDVCQRNRDYRFERTTSGELCHQRGVKREIEILN